MDYLYFVQNVRTKEHIFPDKLFDIKSFPLEALQQPILEPN